MSSADTSRSMKAPQRANGRARVAAILAAAEDVFAEKGYESATMAEVAIRSGTKIGSLYRFFPNKESLANTLVVDALRDVNVMFDQLDAEAGELSSTALAEALLRLLHQLFARRALRKLSISDSWSVTHDEFRSTVLRRTAAVLIAHSSKLSKRSAEAIACVLVSLGKTIASHDENFGRDKVIQHEFRTMGILYVEHKLSVRS